MKNWGEALQFFMAWSTDIGVVVGAIMIAVGFGKIYEPAGLIIGGLELVAFGIVAASRRKA